MKLLLAVFIVASINECTSSLLTFVNLPEHLSVDEKMLRLKTSQLPDFVNFVFGIADDREFTDSVNVDIWNRPGCFAIVDIHSCSYFGKQSAVSMNVLPLGTDEAPDFTPVQAAIKSVLEQEPSTFMEISAVIEGQYQGNISNAKLNIAIPAPNESDLSSELSSIMGVIEWVSSALSSTSKSGRSVPDFFHFTVTGIEQLKSKHATDSAVVQDSEIILEDVIVKLAKAFTKAYDGNCVFAVACMSQLPLSREPRQAKGGKGLKPKGQSQSPSRAQDAPVASNGLPVLTGVTPKGLGLFYGPHYPAIFNIAFFVTLGFFLIVLSVSIWMWFMNPGKDSIIYRMTMTRAKKD